jgi:hypothetical protein
MPIPADYRTPLYRAMLKEARADPDHPARQLRALEEHLTAVATFMPSREGWAYSTPHAFILDQGRAYTAAPRPKGLRKRTNKLCYRNTIYTVWDHPDWAYVEGFALSVHGLPVEHAWAVTPEGVVVDPTWYEPDLAAYYGVEIPMTVVGAAMCRYRVFGVLGNDWRRGSPILRTGQITEDEEDVAS